MNVARLAAAAIGCTVLVVGLPALLERPKPPPLPDDIGLAHARQAPPVTPARTSPMTHPAKHHATAKDPEPEPRQPHDHERRVRHEPRVRNREQVYSPPAPDPVTASAAAPAAPAPPAPPISPPPYVPPTPAPVATSSPSPPASSSPGGGAGQSSAPSEFGFER